MSTLADPYLDAATSCADLLADAAVAEMWDQPSALAQFTVRALAGHLASQVITVATVIAADPPPTVEAVSLEEHYGRVRWRGADVDADINVEIRNGGEAQAQEGPLELVAAVRRRIDHLRTTLPDMDGQRLIFLPWTGWALTLDDFLVTRMMEIAVHSDDLAVSVGVETPELPVRVLHPVYDLLFVLALRRHGHTAMLRALSRAERAPASIAAI
jgi:hypothetical protein